VVPVSTFLKENYDISSDCVTLEAKPTVKYDDAGFISKQ
jgi:hypothetical protein